MQNTTTIKLITKAEYDKMRPHTQGYVVYKQAELAGSELKGLENPYVEGTGKHAAWSQGALTASIEVQEGDD